MVLSALYLSISRPLKLLIRMSFRMLPTCHGLSFIVTFGMFLFYYEVDFLLLKLQKCHSLELKKKENSLNQVQI